jgi:hypothetical protein
MRNHHVGTTDETDAINSILDDEENLVLAVSRMTPRLSELDVDKFGPIGNPQLLPAKHHHPAFKHHLQHVLKHPQLTEQFHPLPFRLDHSELLVPVHH